jgi:energy-coupling factor transport system permease protein
MAASDFFMYKYRKSWVETWDPRAKIGVVILFGLALLISNSLSAKSVLLALLILLWVLARLPARMLIMTLLSLTLLFASTMFYHTVLLHPWIETPSGGLPLPQVGLVSGLTMCVQIGGLVLLLALLVRTTAPLVLAEGMELLLRPLNRWKVPVHETVLMFSIALQFIPILLAEFELIHKAQVARGGGFQRGGALQRFRGVLPILMPMFVRSIMRAEELAAAMDSRCYSGGDGRTMLRHYKWRLRDTLLISGSFLLLCLAVADRFLL